MEVAIGMAVFVILLVSGSVAITQTQKLAHSNVMHNTARTVIEGYMEQMKSIPYIKFVETMADPDNVPIETKSISSLKSAEVIQYDDPLYVNIDNTKKVLLDIFEESDGSLTPRTMEVVVKPTITDLGPLRVFKYLRSPLTFVTPPSTKASPMNTQTPYALSKQPFRNIKEPTNK